MIFEQLKLNKEVTDQDFNAIYPQKIRLLARKHWTPVAVAKVASDFLVEKPGTRVLDIGSGVGKFCLVGAAHTKGVFTGVEQRSDLAELSNKLSASYKIHNASFLHDNITSIRFNHYDAFYFYNSFFENIDMINKIDAVVKLNAELYRSYSAYIVEQFASLPLGTRLVTYFSPLNVIPGTFKLQDTSLGGRLKFWTKTDVA
jgi:cyclopropane fatty-acyl-phospholipid synthase-like methyltransferase